MTKMLSAAVALMAALALTPAAFGAACADCEPGGGGGGGTGNTAPTAAFSSSASTPFTLVSVQFTNQSTDDGTYTSLWDFGDGTSSTQTSPAHSYGAAGTYTVRLTVTDDGALTNYVEHQITVVNRAPTAGFTMNSVVQPGQDLGLDNISSDMDGSVVGAEWDFGDGSTSTAAEPAKSYTTPGTYNVSLKAIDNNGSYSTLTLPVRVNAAPQGQILVAATQTAGQEVQFGSSASDSDGTVDGYQWDFGDGSPTGLGGTPTHTYAVPGDYPVLLTVTDNDHASTTVDAIVHVVAPPVDNGGDTGNSGGNNGGDSGGSTTGGGTTGAGSTTGGSSTGGSTTGGPTQDGAAAGADKSAPALVVPAKLKAKKKAGKLVYTVSTDEAATIVAKLTGKVKGGATIKIAKAGKGKVTIKLSSKAKKALKAAKVVRLTLVTTATDAAGNKTTKTTKVQLV